MSRVRPRGAQPPPVATSDQRPACVGRRPGPVALRLRPGHRSAPEVGFAVSDPGPPGRPRPAGNVVGARRGQPAARHLYRLTGEGRDFVAALTAARVGGTVPTTHNRWSEA